MKFLRTLALLGICSTPLCAQQATTIAYGRMTLNFSTDFQSGLNEIDGALINQGQSTPGYGLILPINQGIFDLQKVSGEMQTAGGIGVRIQQNVIEAISLRADFTDPSAPVVTGWFVLNGSVQVREAIFTLKANGVKTGDCLQTEVLCLPTYSVFLSRDAAQTVNSLLQFQAVAEGMYVGDASIYAVLSHPNSTY